MVKPFTCRVVRARAACNLAVSGLLIYSVRSRLIVNPVLFPVDHSRASAGHRAHRPSSIERA